MVHVGVDLSFDSVHTVLAATVLELDRNKDKIASPGPKDDVEQIKVGVKNWFKNLLTEAEFWKFTGRTGE